MIAAALAHNTAKRIIGDGEILIGNLSAKNVERYTFDFYITRSSPFIKIMLAKTSGIISNASGAAF